MACDFRTFSVLQGSFLIPVLFIFSLFNGIYSQTTIPGNPTLVGDFEKNEGETVTLSCSSVGGNPLPSVQWYKNQQLVDPGSSANGDGIYTVGSSTVTYNNYTFTVSRSDNLVSYICKVQNSLMASPLERAWTISVYVPSEQPFISGPEPAITTALNSGSTYKYVCTAQNGRPAPNLVWKLGTTLANAVEFHQGITENTTTNADSTLSKSSSVSWVPIVDDNGKNLYCQTVQTTAGGGTVQKSTSVPIVVQQIPILQIATTSYTAQVGSTVTLACTVLSATPGITDLYWRRLVNGQYTRITIDNFKFSGGSTSNANLTINNVALSDQNSYQCSATNSAGTGNSGATTLTVTGTLPTVQVGSSGYSGITGGTVTLVCTIISSNPSATSVIWEKDVNGNPTNVTSLLASRISGGTVTQPSLTISSLTAGDSGLYYCSAANSVGTGSRSSTTLTVQSRPSIVLPTFTYNAQFGQDVTLVCNVTSATTLTNVRWRKYSNGVPNDLVVTGSSHYSGGSTFTPSLTILTLTFSDSGNYDCSAENVAGTTTSSQMTLNVIGTVPNVNIPQTSYSVSYGGTVTLVCVVNSNPFQSKVEWQRIANGVSTTINVTAEPRYSGGSINTPSLTISGAVSIDSGVYVCSATNDAGKGVSGQTVLSVQGNVPSVSIGQTSYSIFVGSSVTLNCFVSGNPAVTLVFWTVTRNGFTQNAQNSRYSNGDVNNPSLTITNAQQSDTGLFTCKAQNSAGTTDGSPISLTVSGTAPTVTMSQTSYSVFTNGEVTLSCSVSANPTATISWTFTSNSGGVTAITSSTTKYTLATSSTASTLTVRSANSNDQGSYTCSATNSVGNRQATATLVVSGSLPTISLPSTYSVITGSDITMTCTVSASPAVNSVSWQFQSASSITFTTITNSSKYSISSLTGTSSLTVRNTISSDNGQYRCRAENQVGTSQSTTVLTVSGSIPVVTLPTTRYEQTYGQNVTMQCSITATPDITEVRWQRFVNGAYQNIVTQSSTKYFGSSTTNFALSIANLDFTDSGDYRCTATNQVGQGVSPNRATLSVLGGQPTPFIPLTSYSVLIGNDIQIPCSVSANPAATSIQWQFTSSSGSNTQITQSTTKYTLVGDDSTTSNLTINSAALTDAGTYRCSATNIVGTGTDSATLTITGITPNVTIPDTSLSVQKRQNITIVCEVTDALPKETSVLWEFRANQGDSGTIISVDGNPTKYQGGTVAVPSLTILSVAASDEGYYTCIATNVFGEGRSEQAFLEATGSAATITVSPASQSVLQKNTATIQCIINNANPGVTEVSWEKVSSGTTSSVVVTGRFNGSTPSLPDLIISDLQPSDAGTYYCSARNAIGTSRSSTGSTLVVTGAVPSSMQISGPTSQTVNLGGSLTLQCSGQGDPAPTLTWIFSSSTSDATTVGTGTTYSITNAQRTNGGTYVCRGTNTLGSTDSQGVTVDVQYAPIDARTDAQKSLSASVGSTVSLVCAVDANPSASYEWFRSNQQVSTQREYTFTLSSLALLGSYTCRATNSRGSVQLLYTLSQASSGNTGASTASSGLSTGEIAAIILAVLLLLILIIIIIICCLTHGACGVICGKKQEVKGRVEPEKEVYKETQKEVIIPRFHEESIKGKREPAKAGSYRSFPARATQYRQPSAVSRKDVDVRVQNGGFRRENDYEIVRYETVPAPPPISTQYITESPRPHHLPALSYTYEDVEKKRKKRRKKKKHHHRRHRDEAEEVDYPPSPGRRRQGGYYDDERIIETRRSTARSPQRYRRESDEEMIIERRSPSTKRRYEENYITEERFSSGDVIQDDGDLRAYNGVVYREAPSRHSGGHYRVHGSERRSRSRSGRRERGSDDDVEVVYGKEYVVER